MNSIGIPEGAEFREKMPKCTCVWVTLLCIPPIHRLETKCEYCKNAEKERGTQSGAVSDSPDGTQETGV